MFTSRLEESTNAPLRDVQSLRTYCDQNGIPYSQEFGKKILPNDLLRRNFVGTYSLTPFPPTTLKHQGTSTVLVFESKEPQSNHGDVVSAISEQVGSSLAPPVKTVCIHRSLNPNYRTSFERRNAEAVSALVENQGVPVLHSSIWWEDNFLDFDVDHDSQLNHLWRVTAFLVDSAGNNGRYGTYGNYVPFQKHNALTHFAPLAVRVGAAAMDQGGTWCIEGYSSANSPTFLAPVASRTEVVWHEGRPPQSLTGTSAAAPYISGMLAALNHRYGAYLTREQILYAVIATCTPIKHVNAYGNQTPKALDIAYGKNAAGLSYNAEYGGFGLVHPHMADKLLSHMVDLTQKQPEAITVPTEERMTILGTDKVGPDARGLYNYSVTMPTGFALKTSVEADFFDRHGTISITSPSGTTLPMVMSALNSSRHHFGMSTSHGWAGEPMSGSWTITSTRPIKNLRLSQHHFLERDIIHELDVPKLLKTNIPDLQYAIPLYELKQKQEPQRVLHTDVVSPSRKLGIGLHGAPPDLSNAENIITQLSTLPSGFARRHRKSFLPRLYIDIKTDAGRLENEAIQLLNTLSYRTEGRDEIRHQAIEKQMAATREYLKSGKILEQITPLCNAGYNCLACEYVYDSEGHSNAEKAISIYTRALLLCKRAELHSKAYEISCNLYTALCRCCEQGNTEKFGAMLEKVRNEALEYARGVQGPTDNDAHRIEEGEFGFSSREKIGTDTVSQCITIIVQNPHTLKTGIAHVDSENDISSLDNFFSQFGEDRLNIRLIGARFDEDYRTRENISTVMTYLSHKNADIISADVYGGNGGPSTVVVNPLTFTLEERVPGKHNKNEAASNAILRLTRIGKPLIKQFDYTQSHLREPIHLSARMLTELRQDYFGKKEWEMEGYLSSKAVYDRPLQVAHLFGLEQAYNEEWDKLTKELSSAIQEHGITGLHAEQARNALLNQSIYIGENAEAANAPIYDWIRNRLFREDSIQRTEIKGPTAELNFYDPKGPPVAGGHIGQQELRSNGRQQQRI